MPFQKGHKFGKTFSSDYQPPKENVGKKARLPILEDLLARIMAGEQQVKIGRTVYKLTGAEAMMMAMHKEALGGNVKAAELLLNRSWGMLKQSVDVVANIQSKVLSPEQFNKLLENVANDKPKTE